MIKLLSVSGSPAAGSSTDLLLREIGDTIAAELRTEDELQSSFVKLNELKYIPCQACGKAPTPKFCFFDDSLTPVYDLLAECDCLLFGSPVYFDSVSGQAKTFVDRCNCFRPFDFDGREPEHRFIKLLTRKRPGAIVLVGGDKLGLEGARRTVAGFFKWVEVTNEGVLKYRSLDDHLSGTVADDDLAMDEARQLGRKLANLIREQRHER
jgi:multimeric flavodoxin WrbA